MVLESNLEEIDRMTRIVDELLFLSRADMGEVKMERVPVKLESLLEDIHRQASLLGQDQNVQVVLGLVMPAVVLGDELRLRELFLNLVDNAVKFNREGGSVTVRAEPLRAGAVPAEVEGRAAREGGWRVQVEDTGIGIPPDELEKVFHRFYRVDRARSRETGGTGLGLSIVKHLMRLHGGTVRIEAELGRGTRVILEFPAGAAVR